MAYLDLLEIPALVSQRVLSASRFGAASFRRRDHLRSEPGDLDAAVRAKVARETGLRPGGPIRLLTQLSHFGYFFSPLNLYYCFAPDESSVEFIVAEVGNTPWGEQHCYVLWDGNRCCDGSPTLRFEHAKAFHVSPFMDMDFSYRWRLRTPADSLSVRIENMRNGKPLFDACLTMKRRPLHRRSIRRVLAYYPLFTSRIWAAIYWEAFQLWRKNCRYHPHPKHQSTPEKGS